VRSVKIMAVHELTEKEKEEIVEAWVEMCNAMYFHDVEVNIHRDMGKYHVSILSPKKITDNGDLKKALKDAVKGLK